MEDRVLVQLAKGAEGVDIVPSFPSPHLGPSCPTHHCFQECLALAVQLFARSAEEGLDVVDAGSPSNEIRVVP
eukprot:1820210-Heterocapsa_arctica.AAC.1